VANTLELGGAEQATSIAELYQEVEAALLAAFPRSRNLWVRGEIQKISESGPHAYIDLVDPDHVGDRQAPTLKVKCWRSTWAPLKADLAAEGIFLAAGMTVVIRGSIDFYKARAEVSFILAEVDVMALLGRIAKERQALIDALQAEDLFDAQRRLEVPLVPIRVGLVGSPNTEGFNDFLGQLDRSGFSFAVHVVRASVQGAQAPVEVARGIKTLEDASVDVICVVRGGGSKGDLAGFDAPEVARAVAGCSVPVWTGIGHTGDESVADLVANRRHITPTACGAAVVERVASYWSQIVGAAARISRRSEELCHSEELNHARVRASLVSNARGRLREHHKDLLRSKARLLGAPSATLSRASGSVHARAQRLVPAANAHLVRAAGGLDATRRLLAAYDPKRTLERGWTLTMDADGKIIRSIEQVAEGAMITTRVSDGTVASTVSRRMANSEEP